MVACGGGGSDSSSNVQDETNGFSSVRTATRVIAPGSSCEFGGVEIDAGIDDHQNGTLDPAEVDETSTICNGAAGFNSLVRINNESAGVNCASGGVKLTSGLDLDRDDNLDPTEIDSTDYVCNGATGIAGTDGTSCSVTDNGNGTSTISCTDGTSSVVSDGTDGTNGTDGTDNSAIASIFCNGGLQNWPGISWGYSVHQLNSGDVIASGEIATSSAEICQTNYYSLFQNGYT